MKLLDAPLLDLTATTADRVDDTSAPTSDTGPKTFTRELLERIAEDRAVAASRELSAIQQIVHWAGLNTVHTPEVAATVTERGLDTGLPVAGEGAPLISDFAIIELAAVLGRGLDSARSYVGCVVELAHRLPGIWHQVQTGLVPVWKALRIADHTRVLNQPAAAFVDHQLARFAAGCSWAQIDRLIDEALTRFQPDEAEARRKRAEENRRFDIHLSEAGTSGTVAVDGTLDIADALDLEHAIADKARELAALGCDATRDVRRSLALGEIARDQIALDLGTDQPTGEITDTDAEADTESNAPPRSRRTTGRGVELSLHLTDRALAGEEGENVGRLGNLQVPVTVEQIRRWCGTAGRILVRPVLDLAGCEPVDSYEIPDRHRRIVRERDHHCVAPYCTRPAVVCDIDHITPHAAGGSTCPCNLAPPCRGHHRAKTHDGWDYEMILPTVYLWTSPSGHRYLVTPAGTRALDGQPGSRDGRCATSSTAGQDPPEE